MKHFTKKRVFRHKSQLHFSRDLVFLRGGKPSNWSRMVFENFTSKND